MYIYVHICIYIYIRFCFNNWVIIESEPLIQRLYIYIYFYMSYHIVYTVYIYNIHLLCEYVSYIYKL